MRTVPRKLYAEACAGCKHLKHYSQVSVSFNLERRHLMCTLLEVVVPLRRALEEWDDTIKDCPRHGRHLTLEKLGEL